jgi:hypothetical protein
MPQPGSISQVFLKYPHVHCWGLAEKVISQKTAPHGQEPSRLDNAPTLGVPVCCRSCRELITLWL